MILTVSTLSESWIYLLSPGVFEFFFPLRSWETPNEPGIGCKSESSCDSSNFLLFLQQLRGTSAGKKISVTASVYPAPFGGPNGGSLTDVSAYAKVLDYVG